ncbi:MAG: hypothetical protein EXX96DRAFT_576894 [Benjaminiella poitrasii]|nr:MAG: hypothetical protein EXX96DRAFT_576894 [Benjaminiella poitrasii]
MPKESTDLSNAKSSSIPYAYYTIVRKSQNNSSNSSSNTSSNNSSLTRTSYILKTTKNNFSPDDKLTQYQATLRKLNGLSLNTSKSETTAIISNSKQGKNNEQLQRHVSTTTTTRDSSLRPSRIAVYNSQLHASKKEGDNTAISKKLRSTFKDLSEFEPITDAGIIDIIKRQMNAQSLRIKQLEKALKEAKEQTIKEENGKEEQTISLLLKRYPQSMNLFRQQIEREQFDKQLKPCINHLEDQGEHLLEEFQYNFDRLKASCQKRFDELVEEMICDPSRLNKDWAKRMRIANDDDV